MEPRAIYLAERPPLPPPPAPRRFATMFGQKRAPAPAALPAGLRLYAIGDIHGRLDLLVPLLDAIRSDHLYRTQCARVEVVLLGDLIDRGDASAGVVARAMAGLDWATLHTLMGNHEHAMLGALAGDPQLARIWLANGGVAALASWGVDAATLTHGTTEEVIAAGVAAVPRGVLAWLGRLPVSLRRGDYHFVHAGVRPGVPLDRQAVRDLLWIRDEFLDSDEDHGATIVHGHTVFADLDERRNRIGVDTGAHMSGRLTALALEGTHRWTLQT